MPPQPIKSRRVAQSAKTSVWRGNGSCADVSNRPGVCTKKFDPSLRRNEIFGSVFSLSGRLGIHTVDADLIPLAMRTMKILCGVAIVFAAGIYLNQEQAAQTPAKTGTESTEIASLKAQIEELKGKVPDQSHAMKDVGYHFANLWFAGEAKNWPLAKFYLDESRSHLRWAVRIIPVRKTKAGDVDLRGILQAVDSTFLTAVDQSIQARDHDGFEKAYKQTLEGCYACHKASEKPYLRPQVPKEPETRIINFDASATWPD